MEVRTVRHKIALPGSFDILASIRDAAFLENFVTSLQGNAHATVFTTFITFNTLSTSVLVLEL